MKGLVAFAACLATLPALAQEVPKSSPADNPALKNFVLALQQIGVAAELYVNDSNQRLAAKDARIAEWEAYFKAYVGEPKVVGANQ